MTERSSQLPVPLPEPFDSDRYFSGPEERTFDLFTADQMQSYARACMAPLQEENARLKAAWDSSFKQAMENGARANSLQERADALQAENARLKTVMIAAAEEIHAHWAAHCDAEGYGPQNLQRRLEEGIASEYGYTAGAFAELKARADALEEALRNLIHAQDRYWAPAPTGGDEQRNRAINAARSLINPTGGESS